MKIYTSANYGSVVLILAVSACLLQATSTMAFAPTSSRTTSTRDATSLTFQSVHVVPTPPITTMILHASNGPIDQQEGINKEGFLEKILSARSTFTITGAVFFLTALLSSVTVINTGEVGIISQLGDLKQVNPGVHLVAPIVSSVDRLSTKTNLLEIESSVPTREGLTVTLETSILYRLDAPQVKNLYAKVGPAFERRIISSELASAVKGLTAESDAKALYTSGRSGIQTHLQSILEESLGPRGIIIEDVLTVG